MCGSRHAWQGGIWTLGQQSRRSVPAPCNGSRDGISVPGACRRCSGDDDFRNDLCSVGTWSVSLPRSMDFAIPCSMVRLDGAAPLPVHVVVADDAEADENHDPQAAHHKGRFNLTRQPHEENQSSLIMTHRDALSGRVSSPLGASRTLDDGSLSVSFGISRLHCVYVPTIWHRRPSIKFVSTIIYSHVPSCHASGA
jgi:hypothetical protein